MRSEELEGGEFRREGTGKEGKEHLSWKVSWLLGGEANGIESRSLRWRWISASMDGKGGEGCINCIAQFFDLGNWVDGGVIQ